MPKAPGYYTILVAGAIARLVHVRNDHPSERNVIRELIRAGHLRPDDAVGWSRVRQAYNDSPILSNIQFF